REGGGRKRSAERMSRGDGSVAITIFATIHQGTVVQTVTNQGTVASTPTATAQRVDVADESDGLCRGRRYPGAFAPGTPAAAGAQRHRSSAGTSTAPQSFMKRRSLDWIEDLPDERLDVSTEFWRDPVVPPRSEWKLD